MKFLIVCLMTLVGVTYSQQQRRGPWLFPDTWDTPRGRRDTSKDPHNDEFCVDVSTYGIVQYEPVSRKKCETTFEKICETKTEQVCDEVTEIECDIVPYTECSMKMEQTPYKSFDMVPQLKPRQACNESTGFQQHTKMMPECKNVTKQNCVTKWETDEATGNQVWAGNEDCEPVTWRECQLVPRQVDFKVPKIDCFVVEQIPYMDCVDVEKVEMTLSMVCEVKHTTDCKPSTNTKCKNISFQECHQEPRENCTEIEIMIPEQEFKHKKKCLLPDDGTAGNVGAVTPRGNKADLIKLAADAAAASALEESESQQQITAVPAVPAKPLPASKRPNAGQQESRQGKTFQGQVSEPRVHPKGGRSQQ